MDSSNSTRTGTILGLMLVTRIINKLLSNSVGPKILFLKLQCFRQQWPGTVLKVFKHFSTSVRAAGTSMISTINFFQLFVKSNKEARMGYLDFKKIASRTLLLEVKRKYSMESASTEYSSVQPQDVLPPRRAPAKYPNFG
jgi:hypothetical protein